MKQNCKKGSKGSKDENKFVKKAIDKKKAQAILKHIKKADAKIKGAIYCRTSSEANKDGASMPRQKTSGKKYAEQQNVEVVESIMEIISGSLPKTKRVKFNKLLADSQNKNISRIFMETRALARDADVGEELYKESVQKNVEMHCRDAPGIFSHNPSPVQQFMRRVVLAMVELEKNLIVARLADGREEASKKAAEVVQQAKRQGTLKVGMLTQDGNAKTVGATSYLAWCAQMTKSQKMQLKAAIKDKDDKKIGWRSLQKRINNILDIDLRSHESARRFANEFKMYIKNGGKFS